MAGPGSGRVQMEEIPGPSFYCGKHNVHQLVQEIAFKTNKRLIEVERTISRMQGDLNRQSEAIQALTTTGLHTMHQLAHFTKKERSKEIQLSSLKELVLDLPQEVRLLSQRHGKRSESSRNNGLGSWNLSPTNQAPRKKVFSLMANRLHRGWQGPEGLLLLSTIQLISIIDQWNEHCGQGYALENTNQRENIPTKTNERGGGGWHCCVLISYVILATGGVVGGNIVEGAISHVRIEILSKKIISDLQKDIPNQERLDQDKTNVEGKMGYVLLKTFVSANFARSIGNGIFNSRAAKEMESLSLKILTIEQIEWKRELRLRQEREMDEAKWENLRLLLQN
eukprot:Gb_41389 [translate_table: standard]